MPKDVQIPGTSIVCIEHDGYARLCRHKDGIAESSIQRFAVDLDHLKGMSVQVHRVRHAGLIDKLQRDSLTVGTRFAAYLLSICL